MKKKTSAIAIALLLLLLIEGQSIINVKGETLGPIKMDPNGIDFDSIKIFSPKKEAYKTSSIVLNFTVESFVTYDAVYSSNGGSEDVVYSLDGGSIERISNLTMIRSEVNPYWAPVGAYFDVTFRGYLLLSNLTEGNHSLTVYKGHQNNRNNVYLVFAYSDVNFSIDTSPPEISINSPEPNIYNISDVSLNFTVNEVISKATYSLDQQENKTGLSNIIFANLTSGTHNITVYAWDLVGNVGTSTVNFTIEQPLQNQTLPVNEIIIGASLVLIVATVLTIVFFKRRRTTASK